MKYVKSIYNFEIPFSISNFSPGEIYNLLDGFIFIPIIIASVFTFIFGKDYLTGLIQKKSLKNNTRSFQ